MSLAHNGLLCLDEMPEFVMIQIK
ncbi:hypothetical protein F0266_11970 [Vibrio coralliilyticus]|nr:hypothetical protein [Vibrio coralliilyticus]